MKGAAIVFDFAHVLHSAQSLNRVRLFATPGTVAHQAPLSMGILPARILEWAAISSSRGSSLTEIEPASPVSPELAGGFFTI